MTYVERIQLLNFIICAGASIVALLLLLYAYRQRSNPGALWFVALSGIAGFVLSLYALEVLAGDNIPLYISLSKIEYVALTFTPVAWLGFAFSFGSSALQITWRRGALLSIVPILTILLAFTNEWHGLIWAVPRFSYINGVPVFTPDYGAWFWVYVVHSYLIMFGGTLVLIYQAFKSWKNNRTLSVLVLLGALVPWVGNVMAVFDSLNPVPEIWIDALLLGVSLVAFGFALLRLRLLEFLPFAYQTVFNNVPDGIVVLDLHHRILAINAEVLNFYKNQLGNYLGKPVFEVFPDQAEFLREVVEKDDYQVRLSLENRNLSLRVALMHNIRRERIGRLLIITDTTLETMMEQSRKDAEVFSQTMIDVTNNLNSTLDTNKVLLSLLESMQRIVAHDASTIMIYNSATKACHVALTFGYTPEVDADLRTRTYPLKDFWTLRTTAEQRTPLIVTDTSTAEQWTQLESVHKIASFACAPIFVDDELVGFINLDCWQVGKLKNDISPRLQLIANQAAAAFRNARLYEQTRTQADELARNLEALTVANQLNQARAEELETLYAQVQGLEQLKSDMIRVAAHDLKNPLNVIMSYTNMLNEMPEFVPEDINKVYTTMFDSANRMDQIIRDFLSLERIGKIAQELTVSPFDMNEVVKRAQVEFESQLVKKHITLQTDLSNTPCVAIGDEVLTYEALANFVSNAVKYTQEGGNIAIQVTKENDQIKVSVKDDGIGIPEESHDRLFHAWLMFRLSEDEQGKQSKWAKLPCG